MVKKKSHDLHGTVIKLYFLFRCDMKFCSDFFRLRDRHYLSPGGGGIGEFWANTVKFTRSPL